MILICHESPSVRSYLRHHITSVAAGQRVTTAVSVEDLLMRITTERPNLILAPLAQAAEIAARIPDGAIVAITLPHARRIDADAVRIAAAAGVRGFLRADATSSQVAALVREGVEATATAVEPATVNSLTERLLTKRELEVLAGMSRGRSNAEIGKELFLSEDTIKTHARRLFRKLGAHDRAQAVAVGFRLGLLH